MLLRSMDLVLLLKQKLVLRKQQEQELRVLVMHLDLLNVQEQLLRRNGKLVEIVV